MSNLVHSHKQNTFTAKVIYRKDDNRKGIEFFSPKYFQQFLNLHTEVGDNLSVTIANKKPMRTVSQNNYLWAYYNYISSETGHTPEEIHEWSKTACMPTRIANIFGDKVRMKRSTTDLSVSEFIEYIMALESKTGITMPPLENYGLQNVQQARLKSIANR